MLVSIDNIVWIAGDIWQAQYNRSRAAIPIAFSMGQIEKVAVERSTPLTPQA
jgi:hypothetical protein